MGSKQRRKRRQAQPQNEVPHKFAVDERVLCYEPDLKKARVLYDSKVLQVVERKDDKGKIRVEYKIHFFGWNSSWDRYVDEDCVLKDTDENRALQKELKAKADVLIQSLTKNKKKKKKTITELVKEITKEKGTKSGSGDRNDGDGERSSSESEYSDLESSDDEGREPIQIIVTEKLKAVLEVDYYNVCKKKMLVQLPAAISVNCILEGYVKFLGFRELRKLIDDMRSAGRLPGANLSGAKRTASSGKTPVRPLESFSEELARLYRKVQQAQEVVYGLKTIFDYMLCQMLLYHLEEEQYQTVFQMRPRVPVINCSKIIPQLDLGLTTLTAVQVELPASVPDVPHVPVSNKDFQIRPSQMIPEGTRIPFVQVCRDSLPQSKSEGGQQPLSKSAEKPKSEGKQPVPLVKTGTSLPHPDARPVELKSPKQSSTVANKVSNDGGDSASSKIGEKANKASSDGRNALETKKEVYKQGIIVPVPKKAGENSKIVSNSGTNASELKNEGVKPNKVSNDGDISPRSSGEQTKEGSKDCLDSCVRASNERIHGSETRKEGEGMHKISRDRMKALNAKTPDVDKIATINVGNASISRAPTEMRKKDCSVGGNKPRPKFVIIKKKVVSKDGSKYVFVKNRIAQDDGSGSGPKYVIVKKKIAHGGENSFGMVVKKHDGRTGSGPKDVVVQKNGGNAPNPKDMIVKKKQVSNDASDHKVVVVKRKIVQDGGTPSGPKEMVVKKKIPNHTGNPSGTKYVVVKNKITAAGANPPATETLIVENKPVSRDGVHASTSGGNASGPKYVILKKKIFHHGGNLSISEAPGGIVKKVSSASGNVSDAKHFATNKKMILHVGENPSIVGVSGEKIKRISEGNSSGVGNLVVKKETVSHDGGNASVSTKTGDNAMKASNDRVNVRDAKVSNDDSKKVYTKSETGDIESKESNSGQTQSLPEKLVKVVKNADPKPEAEEFQFKKPLDKVRIVRPIAVKATKVPTLERQGMMMKGTVSGSPGSSDGSRKEMQAKMDSQPKPVMAGKKRKLNMEQTAGGTQPTFPKPVHPSTSKAMLQELALQNALAKAGGTQYSQPKPVQPGTSKALQEELARQNALAKAEAAHTQASIPKPAIPGTSKALQAELARQNAQAKVEASSLPKPAIPGSSKALQAELARQNALAEASTPKPAIPGTSKAMLQEMALQKASEKAGGTQSSQPKPATPGSSRAMLEEMARQNAAAQAGGTQTFKPKQAQAGPSRAMLQQMAYRNAYARIHEMPTEPTVRIEPKSLEIREITMFQEHRALTNSNYVEAPRKPKPKPKQPAEASSVAKQTPRKEPAKPAAPTRSQASAAAATVEMNQWIDNINQYIFELQTWRLLPPENYLRDLEPDPSMVYGLIHLLRFFIKIPEILNSMMLPRRKMRIIAFHINQMVEHIHSCYKFQTNVLYYYPDRNPLFEEDHAAFVGPPPPTEEKQQPQVKKVVKRPDLSNYSTRKHSDEALAKVSLPLPKAVEVPLSNAAEHRLTVSVREASIAVNEIPVPEQATPAPTPKVVKGVKKTIAPPEPKVALKIENQEEKVKVDQKVKVKQEPLSPPLPPPEEPVPEAQKKKSEIKTRLPSPPVQPMVRQVRKSAAAATFRNAHIFASPQVLTSPRSFTRKLEASEKQQRSRKRHFPHEQKSGVVDLKRKARVSSPIKEEPTDKKSSNEPRSPVKKESQSSSSATSPLKSPKGNARNSSPTKDKRLSFSTAVETVAISPRKRSSSGSDRKSRNRSNEKESEKKSPRAESQSPHKKSPSLRLSKSNSFHKEGGSSPPKNLRTSPSTSIRLRSRSDERQLRSKGSLINAYALPSHHTSPRSASSSKPKEERSGRRRESDGRKSPEHSPAKPVTIKKERDPSPPVHNLRRHRR